MDFLERDLEDILFKSDKSVIQNRGLSCFIYDHIFRQVNITGYGIIDLLTISCSHRVIVINIYELKNKQLNASAFWQTVRYIKAVKDVISSYHLHNHHIDINGFMIGREIDTSGDFCFLPTINSSISMFTYNYELDGIRFKSINDVYTNKTYRDDFDFTKLLGHSLFSFASQILNPPPF